MGGWNLVDKVQIGGFSITNLPVVFADVSPFHQHHLDNKAALLLRMDVLQRFDRIAVDFGRQRVHFLFPDGVAPESPLRLASRSRQRTFPRTFYIYSIAAGLVQGASAMFASPPITTEST